jgi:hypothetical protein
MAIKHFDVLRRVGNNVEVCGHLFIDSPLIAKMRSWPSFPITTDTKSACDLRSFDMEFYLRALEPIEETLPRRRILKPKGAVILM